MPRVHVQTARKSKYRRRCHRCHQDIVPGMRYKSWSFRYGGTYYACDRPECAPQRSDLTQSKMGEVYAAIETAERSVAEAEDTDDLRAAIDSVVETVDEVAAEYREAAEPFGGEGEHAERADELESWSSELQGFDPDEDLEVSRPEAEELLGGCPL